MSKYDSHLKCSFCGKSQEQVRKLIAGPGVYICDECVDLCNEILDEELLDTNRRRRRHQQQGQNHLKNAVPVRTVSLLIKSPNPGRLKII